MFAQHCHFCLLLVVSSVGALFVAIIAAAFAYDLAGVKRFDPGNVIYGFSFFVQPLVALLAAAGQTCLVVWLLRAHRSKSHEI